MLDAELDTDGLAERITDNVDAARMAAHEQIDAGATGFVCASDTMAMGVLRAFDERSMHAGSDVGVVGFDDSAAAQVTGLSSVRQPLEQVAVELVGLLRAALDGVPTPASGTVLTPTLVVRTSSLRAAERAAGIPDSPGHSAPPDGPSTCFLAGTTRRFRSTPSGRQLPSTGR